MWQIDNRTPFAADRGWVRDRRGTEVWLVAVKCTFDVGPDGSTVVSAHQPPVLRAAEYTGAPGKSSLRFDSDLILTNKTTDVIVVGDAHAPGGRPVAELDVGLRVGPIQKILRVVGDRVWGAFGASTPEPFVRMPLLYECAFGGVDGASANPERATEWRNPSGPGLPCHATTCAASPCPTSSIEMTVAARGRIGLACGLRSARPALAAARRICRHV